ncbi:MAG TPA: hypothetical protein PKV93_13110 [Fervidobacterium sp.]|nr:hypothetical protein [Fervidobacterium sp.]
MIRILFAGECPNLEFVEVEDGNGKSVRIGKWTQEGEYSVLNITSNDIEAVVERGEQ